MTAFFVLLTMILCFSHQILTAFGQDRIVIEHAVKYITIAIPAIYFLSLFHTARLWMNAMKFNYVPMACLMFAIPLHIMWCHLFVNVWKMDLEGIAYAFLITCISLFVFITICTCNIQSINEAVFLPTPESWKNWSDYIKIAIPSTLMVCAEELAIETFTLMAGLISVYELGASSVIFNLLVLVGGLI